MVRPDLPTNVSAHRSELPIEESYLMGLMRLEPEVGPPGLPT